jgi:hypothetical protein
MQDLRRRNQLSVEAFPSVSNQAMKRENANFCRIAVGCEMKRLSVFASETGSGRKDGIVSETIPVPRFQTLYLTSGDFDAEVGMLKDVERLILGNTASLEVAQVSAECVYDTEKEQRC